MKTKAEPVFGPLSEQEFRVAELIAWGASKQEVADTLFVEYTTIDSHIQSIYKKLRINKLNAISAWYFQEAYELPHGDNPRAKKYLTLLFILLLPVGYLASRDNGSDMIRTARVARAGRSSGRVKRSECEFELC